jgi:hypothetical protein
MFRFLKLRDITGLSEDFSTTAKLCMSGSTNEFQDKYVSVSSAVATLV